MRGAALAGLLMAAVTAGCSRSGSGDAAPASAEMTESMPRAEAASMIEADRTSPVAMLVPLATDRAADSAGGSAPTGVSARMIVRTAELSLQVRDVRKTVQAVSAATSDAEGFLGASRFWHDGDAERASLTVRVPAERLDAVLASLRGLAVRVENESVSGEDVTRQAVDLGARLTNLRATEAELRALLATVRVKTQKASDVLEVHTELARVRGEIEQHTASLQSLSQMAALSTITVTLMPDVVATPIATTGWEPRASLHAASRALVQTFRVVVDAGIWAVVYGVPMLAVAAGLGLGVRAVRRRTRRGPVVMPG